MLRGNARAMGAPVGAAAAALGLTMLACWCLVSVPPAAAASITPKRAAVQDKLTEASARGNGVGGVTDYPYGPGGGDDHDDSYGPGGGGKHGKKDKDEDKLPFRTGAIVLLTSPWLDAACDTRTDPDPYGPYGPGGDMPYGPGGSSGKGGKGRKGDDGHGGGWWPGRRMLSSADGDGGDDAALSYPYGPGGDDDDPAAAVVWCNASIPDGPPQPYPYMSTSSSWLRAVASFVANAADAVAAALGCTALGSTATDVAAADAAVQSGGAAALAGSQWDLDGYVLMGTDFTTADVTSGGRVFLKNQNKRKFCRLLGSKGDDLAVSAAAGGDTDPDPDLDRRHRDRDGDRDRLPPGTLVCDAVTSGGEETEFVVERVADRRAAAADGGDDGDWPDGSGGGKGGRPDGGGPDSGDGRWPGGGGDDGEKATVLVRLRAPQNGMRYCAPDRRIRGAPIVCDLSRPDTSHRAATTFRLTDAAPSHPSGASAGADADPSWPA